MLWRGVLCGVMGVALLGCGGDGGSGGGTALNRFRGSYVGSFTASNGQTGAFDIQVSADGTVSATISSATQQGATGTVTGHVSSDGVLTGVVTFADPAQNATATGSFQRNGDGPITGTLNLTSPSGTVTLTISVTPGGAL